MSNTPLAQPLRLRTSRLGLYFLNLALLLSVTACSEQVSVAPPPPEIPVVNVIQRDQPITMEMVGQTRGSSDVSIRARVDGFLEGMHFTEGNNVEKGELLYTIDDIPFETEVVEAQGQLAEAQTNLARFKSDLARIKPLADMNAVSQMDLDAAVAAYDAAIGALQSAKAKVEQKQILKSYCHIYSPINGRIGISEAEVGEYVGGAGNGLLNLVSQVDPIRVRFSIDEKSYLRFARKLIGEKKPENDRYSESGEDDLILILADGSTHNYAGRVVTSDAVVDPATGTFTMEADFPNPNHLILAGQYARIRTDIEVRKGALLVPQRSITELQGGFSLFVVDAQNKVERRAVELGPKINKLQIVNSGLKATDKIVLEGGQKLRTGMTITPKPTDFSETASSTSTTPED